MYTTCETGYLDIPLARVYDNAGNDITDYYTANDAEVADLDGDGEMEIILKRRSTLDDAALYVSRTDGHTTASTRISWTARCCGGLTWDPTW